MYLPFISDEDLARATGLVVHAIHRTRQEDFDIARNVLDPFAALFQCAALETGLDGWKKFERDRQTMSAIQSAIGAFHQEVIASLPGWRSVEPGAGLDVINVEKAICAEVKNKYNTTKGNHRPKLYDDMERARAFHQHDHGKDFTAFYVHIVPRHPKDVDRPFTPSDVGPDRPLHPRIREITGALFFDRATGTSGALRKLYEILPNVLKDVFALDNKLTNSDLRTLYNTSIRPPSDQ